MPVWSLTDTYFTPPVLQNLFLRQTNTNCKNHFLLIFHRIFASPKNPRCKRHNNARSVQEIWSLEHGAWSMELGAYVSVLEKKTFLPQIEKNTLKVVHFFFYGAWSVNRSLIWRLHLRKKPDKKTAVHWCITIVTCKHFCAFSIRCKIFRKKKK